MRHTRLSLSRFVGLLSLALLLGGATLAPRALALDADNVTVLSNLTQVVGGTNTLAGRMSIGKDERAAPLSLSGWDDDEDILDAFGDGETTESFALRMNTDGPDRLKFRVQDAEALSLSQVTKAGFGVSDTYMTESNAAVEVDGDLLLSGGAPLVLSDAASGDENWALQADGDRFVMIEKEHQLEAFCIRDTGSGYRFVLKASATNSTWLTLEPDGSVGIGLTNAAAKLHVDGDAQITGSLLIRALAPVEIPMGCYTNQ